MSIAKAQKSVGKLKSWEDFLRDQRLRHFQMAHSPSPGQQFEYVGNAFVIIQRRGGANGKHLGSDCAVGGGTATRKGRTSAHRRGIGGARQQLEAHDLASQPEEDGGSTEGAVAEEAREKNVNYGAIGGFFIASSTL
jgi:hypothetical protein